MTEELDLVIAVTSWDIDDDDNDAPTYYIGILKKFLCTPELPQFKLLGECLDLSWGFAHSTYFDNRYRYRVCGADTQEEAEEKVEEIRTQLKELLLKEQEDMTEPNLFHVYETADEYNVGILATALTDRYQEISVFEEGFTDRWGYAGSTIKRENVDYRYRAVDKSEYTFEALVAILKFIKVLLLQEKEAAKPFTPRDITQQVMEALN
jgi:hypothetical protein